MAVVPFLSTWSPGQGVVGASWLNTAMQGGAMLADLRAFTGLVNMTVQMIGFSAQGDGGQGTFCWSNNPGTDDGGVTCIVPYGVTQGCWLRQVPGYVATLQAVEALRRSGHQHNMHVRPLIHDFSVRRSHGVVAFVDYQQIRLRHPIKAVC